jgi:hypothetical protein
MLHPTDNRGTAGSSLPAGGVAPPIDMAGAYLTDGVFLYRVVGSLADAVDEVVELEDCYGLDVVPVPVSALRSRRFRVVTPAATG